MKLKIFYSLIIAGALTACGDEHVFFPLVTNNAEGAKVKMVHAASDASAVNFYFNGVKVSAGSATGTGIAYAGAFPGTNYSVLAPGTSELKVIVPATTTTPESTLLTTSIETQNNSYYTVALAGISPNYETVLINDDLSAVPFDQKAYVRFVNLIHNSPVENVKVIATLNVGNPPAPVVTVVADNIAYKQASNFIVLDPGDYTIELRNASTNALIATANATTKLLSGNRAYTLFARGQISQTGAKAPTLDRITNR